MKIKFVGHPDGAEVPIPGSVLGGEYFCPFGEPVEIPAELAKRLLEQPGWIPADEELEEEKPAAKSPGKKDAAGKGGGSGGAGA